jgi:hypothetical protein
MDQKLQDRIEQFLDNHWIHMERRVSRLEGKVYLLVGISTLTLAGIVALLTKAWQ